MNEQHKSKYPRSDKLASLANDALRAFREENPEAFKELVKVYDGKSADVALFGHGKFNILVAKGDVDIAPDRMGGSRVAGRGATTPETLMAILEGRLTPLEAFFKGDLVARAQSAELHRAYDYFVRFSEAAIRSQRMQKVIEEFKRLAGVKRD